MDILTMLILAGLGSYLTIYGIVALKRKKLRGPWWTADDFPKNFLRRGGKVYTKQDDPENYKDWVIISLCAGLIALVGALGGLIGFW